MINISEKSIMNNDLIAKLSNALISLVDIFILLSYNFIIYQCFELQFLQTKYDIFN